MRFALLILIATIAACAHGGNGKPDYCKRPFSLNSLGWDLDGDMDVDGADWVIYRDACEGD